MIHGDSQLLSSIERKIECIIVDLNHECYQQWLSDIASHENRINEIASLMIPFNPEKPFDTVDLEYLIERLNVVNEALSLMENQVESDSGLLSELVGPVTDNIALGKVDE